MDQHTMQVWHTWHIAALTRAKKMPPLDNLKPKPKSRKMTIVEMQSAARRWHALAKAKEAHHI